MATPVGPVSSSESGIDKWARLSITDPEAALRQWYTLKDAERKAVEDTVDGKAAMDRLGLSYATPTAPPMGARRKSRKSRKMMRKTKKAGRKGKKSYSRRR